MFKFLKKWSFARKVWRHIKKPKKSVQKTDVLFVTPNFISNYNQIPVGSMLLATILRENGVCADLVQFAHLGNPSNYWKFIKSAVNGIVERKPKVICFYSRCNAYHIILNIAERVKKRLPGAYILLGGPKSDIVSEETVRSFPFVDFVCCGEGDRTITPFVNSLLVGKPDLTIPGLVFMKDGAVVKNPRPELFEDLDLLPDVDLSLAWIPADKKRLDSAQVPVDVGRGCPFNCTFCSTSTFWGRGFRLKSPKRIVEQIQRIHDQLGYTYFVFEHDMFTMKRDKVLETCNLLKSLNFPIQWNCSARLDCIDRELIDAMAEVGLKQIFLGIETGSPRMQKLIKKNLKIDTIIPMIQYISSKSIKVTASFIYGLPEETEEDFLQTIDLIEQIYRIDHTRVIANLCTFLPGTELTRTYKDQLEPCFVASEITGPEGVEENWDFICAHRDVFQEYMEYPSALREKLKMFTNFMFLIQKRRVVYEPVIRVFNNSIYETYLAFTKVYNDLHMRFEELAQIEQFPVTVTQVPEHEIIKEIYRFWHFERSVLPDTVASDVFAFCPDFHNSTDHIEDVKQGKFLVTISCKGKRRTKTIESISE